MENNLDLWAQELREAGCCLSGFPLKVKTLKILRELGQLTENFMLQTAGYLDFYVDFYRVCVVVLVAVVGVVVLVGVVELVAVVGVVVLVAVVGVVVLVAVVGAGEKKNAVEKEKVEALKKTIINTLFNNFNNFLVILSQNTHV
jgi:Flp pilus assembly protein TadB